MDVYLSLSLGVVVGLRGSAALTTDKKIFGTRLCAFQSECTLSGEEKNILSLSVK